MICFLAFFVCMATGQRLEASKGRIHRSSLVENLKFCSWSHALPRWQASRAVGFRSTVAQNGLLLTALSHNLATSLTPSISQRLAPRAIVESSSGLSTGVLAPIIDKRMGYGHHQSLDGGVPVIPKPSTPLPDGIMVVDKPTNWTSSDVVTVLRGTLTNYLKQRGHKFPRRKKLKVGHGGTLDPMATGLLAIGVGDGCKHLQSFLTGGKVYYSSAQLGIETDTQDAWGTTKRSAGFDHVTLEDLKDAAFKLTGSIMQRPPIFSAKKKAGKKMYDLAREGRISEEDLEPVPVTIHRFDVHNFDRSTGRFEVDISCSAGTYVRTLVSDMGRSVGSLAHMASLRRTRHGPFCDADELQRASLHDSSAAKYVRPVVLEEFRDAERLLQAIVEASEAISYDEVIKPQIVANISKRKGKGKEKGKGKGKSKGKGKGTGKGTGFGKPGFDQTGRSEALRVDREVIARPQSLKAEAEPKGLQKSAVPEADSFTASHAEVVDKVVAANPEVDKAGGGGPADLKSSVNRNLNALTGKELQAELRTRGLKVSGSKAELIARLRSQEAEAYPRSLQKNSLLEAVSFTAAHAEVADNGGAANSEVGKAGADGLANYKYTVNRDLTVLKVKELQAELRNRGLKVSGSKTELIARLRSHEAEAGPKSLQKLSEPEAVDFTADHAEAVDNAGAVDSETYKAGGVVPVNVKSSDNRDLNTLTVKELQAELRKHGLKVSGSKAVLIARLTNI